jgi:hypothetical protein
MSEIVYRGLIIALIVQQVVIWFDLREERFALCSLVAIAA